MGMGMGIAGLVLAIVAIFIPLVALYVVWVSLIFTAIAAFAGDKPFSIASWCVNLVNLVLLSPITLAILVGGPASDGTIRGPSIFLAFVTVVLFVLVIVGWFVGRKRVAATVPFQMQPPPAAPPQQAPSLPPTAPPTTPPGGQA
ncbi:MAG: hypothetical protein AB7G15_02265 [Alphaproteobacteria bacterium]